MVCVTTLYVGGDLCNDIQFTCPHTDSYVCKDVATCTLTVKPLNIITKVNTCVKGTTRNHSVVGYFPSLFLYTLAV